MGLFSRIFRRKPIDPSVLLAILEAIAWNLERGAADVFPQVRKNLRRFSKTEGCMEELVALLTKHVGSPSPDITEGCLQLIAKVLHSYPKKLGYMDVCRITRCLLLCEPPNEDVEWRIRRLVTDVFLLDRMAAAGFTQRLLVKADDITAARIWDVAGFYIR